MPKRAGLRLQESSLQTLWPRAGSLRNPRPTFRHSLYSIDYLNLTPRWLIDARTKHNPNFKSLLAILAEKELSMEYGLEELYVRAARRAA